MANLFIQVLEFWTRIDSESGSFPMLENPAAGTTTTQDIRCLRTPIGFFSEF